MVNFTIRDISLLLRSLRKVSLRKISMKLMTLLVKAGLPEVVRFSLHLFNQKAVQMPWLRLKESRLWLMLKNHGKILLF